MIAVKLCNPIFFKKSLTTYTRELWTTNVNNGNFGCKLLVVGCGTGGCSIAAKFALKLGANKVIVLEPEDVHYYLPMFTMIGAGKKELKDSSRPMKTLLPKNAKWIKDVAVQFEPKSNCVLTKNGDTIVYEFLVIAVGGQLHYNKIPGLLEALSIENGKVCSNYSPKYVTRTYQALNNFKEGNGVFTFPNSPVKCPGAPQRILFMCEHYVRKMGQKQNARFIYNTAHPVLFGVKHYADALWKIVEDRNITVNLRSNLIEVLPDKNQAVFENLDKPGEIVTTDYEMLHVTPTMSAPDVLLKNKDLISPAGFLDVSEDTMQHKTFKNIFGIGDCAANTKTIITAPLMAQFQKVYNNMLAKIEGKTIKHIYHGKFYCPLLTDSDPVILAEFDDYLSSLKTLERKNKRNRNKIIKV